MSGPKNTYKDFKPFLCFTPKQASSRPKNTYKDFKLAVVEDTWQTCVSSKEYL